ncbi:F-box/LRR-repeat protein 15 isoform X2 [Dendrobium catenatum]|uniref:F-box/LRR-repeat protein 15 n=1 Tax=Dendrobium catenatum TaxID=906689 RepID=A0A2I0WTP5_9ASPA|nr:F-box/LRR-repeat protein 15 isoform X2 [Dendrobium catenatum]PKU79035.1 F-box/LRR-repeat protein 15 [Dendrobium catenatum]
MAERRSKATAAEGVNGMDVGIEDVGESEELDLRLSIGHWGWSGASSSLGRRSSWLSPFELTVGSSSCSEDLGFGSRLEQNPGEEITEEMEGVELDGSDFHAAERISSDDMDRDAQHKRAKILFDEEAHLIATPLFADETAALPAIENYIDSHTLGSSGSQMMDYCHNIDAVRISELSNGSQNDGGETDTGNVDNSENRMDLTEDLLHLVFSFLSQRDLCKAGATCKQWLAASMHENFWSCLNLEDAEVTLENFEALCHRHPNAIKVNLVGVLNAEMLVLEAMTSLRCLETLYLGKGQLGDGFFQALTDCPALNSLSIYDTSFGNGIQEISVHHDRLHELKIVKCRVLRVAIRCPQLQTLVLKRTSMAHALLSCPQLDELDLSSCHKLSDAGIRSAATSCPLLTSLDLAFCSCTSDETLREIALACPNICVLDVSYCPNISLESVKLPMLTNLKLHNCHGITSSSLCAISHSRMLKALQLDNCSLLTSVSLDLPHLRSISLVHCRKFLDLNLRSQVLLDVKVSNCSLLQRISIVSDALKKLVLQKQESLANLLLQCHNLQEVDLSDCESLTNSVCEIFSDGGSCPMLKVLVLDNCESLTVVRLNSYSLASISLVGCRAMNVLDLSCPNLLKINLDGCDHLKEASLCPVGLEYLNLGICPKLNALQIEAQKMSVLELKGCGMLSQASISCPSLTSLDASFCRQFTDDSLSSTAASCPQIESLILSSCVLIAFDGLSSLHWLQYLTQLDLSYTFLVNLQPVFDSCCQLLILKLSACKCLEDSSLDALYNGGALPALRELDLSYSSIGQAAIVDLLAYCRNLVNVNLNGCACLHKLAWGSTEFQSTGMKIGPTLSNLLPLGNGDISCNKSDHLLEFLNCTGCPYLKKVVIPSTACCFRLTKLNLNLSANLKEVDLACPNLSSLNLSNCSSLEILKLDCPRLTNLQLSACSMLSEAAVEAAISGCCISEPPNVHSSTRVRLLQRITGT